MEKRELIPGCGIEGIDGKTGMFSGLRNWGKKQGKLGGGVGEKRGLRGGPATPRGGYEGGRGPPKNPWKSREKNGKNGIFIGFFSSACPYFNPAFPPCVPVNPKIPPDPGLGSPPPSRDSSAPSSSQREKKKGGKGQKPQKPPKFRGCGCTGNPPKENSRFSCPAPSARGREFGNLGIWGIPSPSSRGKEAPGKIPGFGMGREKGDGDGGNGVGWEGTGENGMKWGKNGMKWEKTG